MNFCLVGLDLRLILFKNYVFWRFAPAAFIVGRVKVETQYFASPAG